MGGTGGVWQRYWGGVGWWAVGGWNFYDKHQSRVSNGARIRSWKQKWCSARSLCNIFSTFFSKSYDNCTGVPVRGRKSLWFKQLYFVLANPSISLVMSTWTCASNVIFSRTFFYHLKKVYIHVGIVCRWFIYFKTSKWCSSRQSWDDNISEWLIQSLHELVKKFCKEITFWNLWLTCQFLKIADIPFSFSWKWII